MREEKKLLLDEIKEKIDSSSSLIITKFTDITTAESWNFRNVLLKHTAEMEVVKKRIFLKAFEKSGYKCNIEQLEGQIAIIFIKDDPIDAVKTIFEFCKQTNKLEVLRGEIDDKTYDRQDLLILSKLSTKDELRAEFLSLLEAPMSGVVSVIDSLLTSILFALEEKKKKLEEIK